MAGASVVRKQRMFCLGVVLVAEALTFLVLLMGNTSWVEVVAALVLYALLVVGVLAALPDEVADAVRDAECEDEAR